MTGNHSATENYYPELTYALTVDKSFQVTDSTLFGGAEAELLVLAIEKTQKFSLLITGSIEDKSLVNTPLDFEKAESQYLAFINGLLHHFELTHTDSSVQQMNQLTRWYTHNMLVHYLSPHGLEQYGGAAWGTRDVSQYRQNFSLRRNSLRSWPPLFSIYLKINLRTMATGRNGLCLTDTKNKKPVKAMAILSSGH